MKQAQLEKYTRFRRLCLANAEDALRAAELLLGKSLNHIVYHLSVLALEELGKVFIGWYQLTQEETWEKEKSNIQIDDHVKKLFFAIWGPTITLEKITKEQFEKNRGFAKQLHDKRLESLYTDLLDQKTSANKISDEETSSVFNFAKATLNLTENAQMDAASPKPSEDSIWFFTASNDPTKRNFIFGNSAQEKLVEFGNIDQWILWLKEKFDKEAESLQTLIQKEVSRVIPSEQDKVIPKWKIKIKLVTSSHIIKANALASFNKTNPYIQLYKGKDTHTLIVDLILGNNVSIAQIWDYGWLVSKFFVAALNIGSNGIFYWNMAVDTEKFYEEITDLENKKKLNARLESGLQLNWSDKMMVLSEQELYLSQIAYRYIVDIRDKDKAEAINLYLVALGLFSKNDIHSRFEVEIFMHLYGSFKVAIHKNEVLSSDDNWHDIAFEQISKLLKNKETYDNVMALALNIELQKKTSKMITLTEVIGMKQYCGFYLLTLAVRHYYKDDKLRLQNDSKEDINSSVITTS